MQTLTAQATFMMCIKEISHCSERGGQYIARDLSSNGGTMHYGDILISPPRN